MYELCYARYEWNTTESIDINVRRSSFVVRRLYTIYRYNDVGYSILEGKIMMMIVFNLFVFFDMFDMSVLFDMFDMFVFYLFECALSNEQIMSIMY